jgi:hypothetical protein
MKSDQKGTVSAMDHLARSSPINKGTVILSVILSPSMSWKSETCMVVPTTAAMIAIQRLASELS